MASQFSGTNGTDIKTSAAPAGASKNLPPLSTKPSTLTPQAQLAAAISRQRSTSPKIMPEERKNNTTTAATATTASTNEPPKQSPNPAALLTAGFGMSSPADAPREAAPSLELGSLPGVAAAAAAMEERESPTATPMSGTDNAGLTATAPQDPGSLLPPEQYPPLQPQPPTPQQPQIQPQHPKDTGTPVTPGVGQNPTTPVTPFSPSGSSAGVRGKHTCPHCMKTFTRHHNLKSHLLTHAHEKPYLCTTCQARFRRLHDLKRHSKLHTGERPHVCTKCGRRFARGDALARHARGEGGCAGRRGSMSGLNEDGSMSVGGEHDEDIADLEGLMDDTDGDVIMDDVGSPAGASGNATAVGGRRRQSLPSLRTDIPNTSATTASAFTTTATPINLNSGASTASSSATLASRHHHLHQHHHHHPHHNNTYPPPSGRSLVTAPATTNPQSTTSTTSSSAPGQTAFSASTPSPLFAPGISLKRTPAPVTTSTPSTTTTTTAATTATTNNTVLSPAGVLTDSPGAVSPGMTRERTPSFTSSGGFLSPPGPAVGSAGTTGGRTGGAGAVGGGAGSSNVFASGMDGVWAYIRSLEDRIRMLEERAGK